MSHKATLLALLVAAVLPPCLRAEPWTEQEQRERIAQQTYHWGQKGEAQPNHGWSNYTRLVLDLGGDFYFVFQRDGGELLASLHARDGDLRRFGALSIPGAGLFYSPDDGTPCARDAIEELGLHAELALFYLSQAFPSGPAAIAEPASKKVRGGPAQLRFMQGVLDRAEAWQVEVGVARQEQAHLHAEIRNPGATAPAAIIDWHGGTAAPVIADAEPLRGWQACWSEPSPAAGGSASNVAATGAYQSFGDLRRALKAQAKPNSPAPR